LFVFFFFFLFQVKNEFIIAPNSVEDEMAEGFFRSIFEANLLCWKSAISVFVTVFGTSTGERLVKLAFSLFLPFFRTGMHEWMGELFRLI